MTHKKVPTDGPHVPEKSAYYDEFLEMIANIGKCPGFSEEDCFFDHKVNGADVLLYFSEKVIEKILKPTVREIPLNKKKNCPIYKPLQKLDFEKKGTVRVSCASDSIHAVYVLIALYINQNLPDKKRKRSPGSEN